ncbi:leucine-rich repeat transmembrane neuronal protein 4-like [Culicoides brevitarsis]|uniref:leucine-rich repeat transmembrane neuronal protein 4-like n=1 Tax=Culicoides brevitarsis TaxID=469753 RepID=UPI00307C145D
MLSSTFTFVTLSVVTSCIYAASISNNDTIIHLECRDDEGAPDMDSKTCIFHEIVATTSDAVFDYIPSEDKNWVKFKNSILYQIPPNLFKNYLNTQTLDVTACQIEYLSSESLVGAENLLYLHMKGNNLTKLGHGLFANAPHLEDLKMQFNHISDIEEQAFSGLAQLRFLYLGKNQLTTLHDGTFRELVNLETLDLSYNSLLEISDELFTTNKVLDSLDLRGNKIGVISPNAFKNLERLSNLDLASNNIKKIPAQAFDMLVNLRSLVLFENNLTELDLTWQDNSGCGHQTNGSKMILPRLTKISLAENKWNCSYLETLMETLENYDVRQLPYKLIHPEDPKINVKGVSCEKVETEEEDETSTDATTTTKTPTITKDDISETRSCLFTKLGY